MNRVSLHQAMLLLIGLVVIALPFVAYAFPFGGRASIVLQCVYNSTIYANLGPPRGGEFIWTTGTKTYQFGPPAYAGQWLLGLAGAPYYCIYRISPLTIYTGIAITMMGSSGSAAAAAPVTQGPGGASGRGPQPPPAAPSPPPASPTPTSAPTNILISEVYYAVDTTHGAKPQNEWIEIYNGTQVAVNLGGWRVEDAFASDTIPSGTILSPGKFLVIAATSTTRTLWNIESASFVSVGNSLGDGLANGGDRIIIKNASGAVIDAVSWGTNTSIFKPSAVVVPYGHSLARGSLGSDTNTAADWVDRTIPTPGK